DATGDGSKQQPYRTLKVGLQTTAGGTKRVYACDDGTGYSEQVVINTPSLDGVRLFGGFACDDWTYSTTPRASGRSPPTNALPASNLATGLVVQDFAFRAAGGTGAGKSSVAVLVTASHGVSFSRVTIVGSGGTDGAAAGPNATAALDGMPGTA